MSAQQAQAFVSAAAAKGLLLSLADTDALRKEGITTAAGMTSLNDADLASARVDAAACRANYARAEAEARAQEARLKAAAEEVAREQAVRAQAAAEEAARHSHCRYCHSANQVLAHVSAKSPIKSRRRCPVLTVVHRHLAVAPQAGWRMGAAGRHRGRSLRLPAAADGGPAARADRRPPGA